MLPLRSRAIGATPTSAARSSASSLPGPPNGPSPWPSESSPTAMAAPLALGLVGLLRMVPSAILAPLLSPIADRGRREKVLILVSVVRGVATAAAAVVVAVAGPPGVIYALAVLSTIAATLYRPAHSALLPSLCRTGFELASANVVRGLLDSAATLVGPLLAARAHPVHGRRRRVRRRRGGVVRRRRPAGSPPLRGLPASAGPEPPEPGQGGRRGSPALSRATATWCSSSVSRPRSPSPAARSRCSRSWWRSNCSTPASPESAPSWPPSESEPCSGHSRPPSSSGPGVWARGSPSGSACGGCRSRSSAWCRNRRWRSSCWRSSGSATP